MTPAISVVIATLNRSASLERLLSSLLRPGAPFPFEIIVVDNGSTDPTRKVTAALAAQGHPIRYVLEERRGVSFARNAGAAAALAPIVAFTDDDQHVAPDWLVTIARVLDANPDVDAIGGRVVAEWEHPRPAWLTHRIFGPVSLFDRGDRGIPLHRGQWMCLPGGNLAMRRPAFEALVGFHPAYPRSQDRELTVRFLLSGRTALYVPELVVYHHLDAQRLTKRHFREWNECEGRMRAGYAFEELFTRAGEIRPLPRDTPRLFGVSRFMYRRLASGLAAWVWAGITGQRAEAFRRELQVRYLWSYVRRRRELLSKPSRRAASRRVSRVVGRVWRMGLAACSRVLTIVNESS